MHLYKKGQPMPQLQELCRVRVSWLLSGQVCSRRMLGLDEYGSRNVIARFERSIEPVCTPLTKEQCLNAMLSCAPRFLLGGGCSAADPLVRVNTATLIYEFEPAGVSEGWLSSRLVESGAESLFGPFARDLDAVAANLASQGQALDSGCWGKSVCFHTLWLIKLAPGTMEFLGCVDLARVPLSLFVEKPAPSAATQVLPLWNFKR